MNQFPNSPFNLASSFVAELQEGKIAPEEFLRRLDLFEESLERWHDSLEAISTSNDYPDGAGLVEDAKESIVATHEGVGILREFAETRNAEAAQEGLELFREASDLMAELIQETEKNMEDLEDDRSNAIGGDLIG